VTRTATIDCPHQTASDPAVVNRYRCALGLYGGAPYLGNCLACVSRQENTPAFAARLEARATLSHPPDQAPVSGCCDPIQP